MIQSGHAFVGDPTMQRRRKQHQQNRQQKINYSKINLHEKRIQTQTIGKTPFFFSPLNASD
jgi:hypothetical protein